MVPSRHWWPTSDQVLRQQMLMHRMIETCGVDGYRAARIDGGLAFLEACTKCRFCPHEQGCRLWLGLDDEVRLPPDFCPNAAFFLSCVSCP